MCSKLGLFVLACALILSFSDADSHVDNVDFFKWLETNGVPISKISVDEYNEKGRGVIARAPIRKDEAVIKVPVRLLMSVRTALQSRVGPIFEQYRDILSPDCILAMHLLYEKYSKDSFWAPYIKLLPKKFSTPLYFADDELAELQHVPLHNLTIAMKQLIQKEYDTMVSKLTQAYPDHFPKKLFTFSSYKWAMSVIWSRALDLIYRGQRIRALVPLSDLLNHGQNINTMPGIDEMSQTFMMTTGLSYRSGEEILISYGQSGNSHLLQMYGFTLPNNEHDSVKIDIRLDDKTVGKDKWAILKDRDLAKNHSFAIYRNVSYSEDMMFVLRIMMLDPYEMDHEMWEAVKDDMPASDRSELEVISSLRNSCVKMLRKFPTSAADDQILLQDPSLSVNARNALLVRLAEKEILENNIAHLTELEREIRSRMESRFRKHQHR